ncbi:TPA: hypothetical protein I7701_20705 [Vibrio vulnificus]|nr:hypothetical protein [Vibrio vulnificus]
MTSPLMKPTLVGRDTLHELDQPLKILAYVSNHWGPLLRSFLCDIATTKLSISLSICSLKNFAFSIFCNSELIAVRVLCCSSIEGTGGFDVIIHDKSNGFRSAVLAFQLLQHRNKQF